MTAPQAARLVRITGRVQGVGFRAWTQSHARKLGLEGWVKNEPDGSVLALIGGTEAQLRDMVEAFHVGPRWAGVTGVDSTPADPDDVPPGFRVTR